jgi:acetaldehyde dehydrogenase (acetylating)
VSFIKKLGALIVLLVGCGYAATAWEAHASFEKASERLVRQLGSKIVNDLASVSATCRAMAKIDSVTIDTAWLAHKGSAVLYLSGKNESAISIDYQIETAGDKIYVKPRDQAAAQLSVMQFGLNSCS